MVAGPLTAANWTVSTRQDGEVLAIWAGSDDLQLGVFATRDGFSPVELDGWLRDLVNVAKESARQDVTAREIPPVLHHALTGLLFSHAELWEREGGAYFSTALVSSEGLAGIGWVGEADLQVYVEGVPQEVDWVVVRDSEGREARAATFDASLPLRIWISWDAGLGAESGVAMDAEWSPEPLAPGAAPAAGGARLIELTAEDLAPALEEPHDTIEPQDAIEPELDDYERTVAELSAAVQAEHEAGIADSRPAGSMERELEDEPADEPIESEDEPADEPIESEDEPLGAQSELEAGTPRAAAAAELGDDFVRGPEWTPPRSRPPSSISQAFDLDRFGVTPFEDALEVAPRQPTEADHGRASSAGEETLERAPEPGESGSSSIVEEEEQGEAIEPAFEASRENALPGAIEPGRTGEIEAVADDALAAAIAAALAQGAADAIEPAPAASAEPAPAASAEPAPADAIELQPAGIAESASAEALEPRAAGAIEPRAAGAIEVESAPSDAEVEATSSVAAAELEGKKAELSPEPRPARRASLWSRFASLWKKRGKRAVEPEEEAIAGSESLADAPAALVPDEEPAHAAAVPALPATPLELEAQRAEPAPAPQPPRRRSAPVISSLQRLKSISVAPPRPAEAARSVPDAPAVTAPVLKVPSLGTPETSSATRLVIQPRDEALAPGATVEVPHGEPLTVQREESPAPAEPVIEKHPARLARPTLTKPGLARPATEPSPPATPPETEAAKPASLPEERLGPIVRTSPERPSLRATPAAPIDETAAPIASEAEPGPRRLIPASDSPEGVASAEGRPNAERVAASEPAAAAAPIPAEAPHEGPAENASPAIESAMAAEPAPEAAEARERVPEAAAAERPAEAAAPAKRRGPAAPAEAPVRAPIRAQWPSEEEMTSPFVRVARVLIGSVIVAALFTGGWLLGGMAPDRTEQAQKTNPFMQLLQVFSFATGRYHVAITTEPDGASVAVDGKDIARRTPATIDLKPGAHQVTLSYPDLGSATFGVRGARDQDVTLHEALWGRLSVEQDNPDVPVKVSVDGRDLGFVPVTIDSVAPGAHEVRFSGPSMTPWAQTVAVKVRESARIVAHPMVSPATGVLTVRATLNDAQGSTPLNGGEVWLDGELVGRTPLTLELPRGPHSVKVVYGQETGAVQVIDLPGGNQRFAAFQLGSGGPDLRLTPASVVGKVLPDQPALVSAGMDGVNASDVREMWLHVRGPDDNWRRYPLNVMKTPAGVVGVTTFPLGVFDDGGLTKYYLSALLITGDEYFTEIASAHLVSAPSAPAAK